VTVLLAPVYFFLLLFFYPWRLGIGPRLIRFYSGICLLIFRVKIEKKTHCKRFKEGKKGLLIISNHASFLDIFVLSALFGCVFVSKSEVRHYPIIGRIAALSGVVFFERSVSGERLRVLRQIAFKCSGRTLAVFPQGTTGRIREQLPFKRGIFKITELNPEITLLPVTLYYKEDSEIAWSRQSLKENAVRVCRQKSIHVKVNAHHPVTIDTYEGKKTAEICKLVEASVLAPLQRDYGDL